MLRGVRGGRYRIEANHDIPPNNTQAIMEALQSGPVACARSLTIVFMEAFAKMRACSQVRDPRAGDRVLHEGHHHRPRRRYATRCHAIGALPLIASPIAW